MLAGVSVPQALPSCSQYRPTAHLPPRCPLYPPAAQGASTQVFTDGELGIGWKKTVHGDSLRAMYTYNNSLAPTEDGSRALCTSEPGGRLGGGSRGWGHAKAAGCGAGSGTTAALGSLPRLPSCSPSPPAPTTPLPAAVERYGGFDFSTHSPNASVFSQAEAIEFWVKGDASGLDSLVFRIGNVLRVRTPWRVWTLRVDAACSLLLTLLVCWNAAHLGGAGCMWLCPFLSNLGLHPLCVYPCTLAGRLRCQGADRCLGHDAGTPPLRAL